MSCPKINFQSETRANAKPFSLFRTKNNLLNQKEKTAEAKKEHFNFFIKKLGNLIFCAYLAFAKKGKDLERKQFFSKKTPNKGLRDKQGGGAFFC